MKRIFLNNASLDACGNRMALRANRRFPLSLRPFQALRESFLHPVPFDHDHDHDYSAFILQPSLSPHSNTPTFHLSTTPFPSIKITINLTMGIPNGRRMRRPYSLFLYLPLSYLFGSFVLFVVPLSQFLIPNS